MKHKLIGIDDYTPEKYPGLKFSEPDIYDGGKPNTEIDHDYEDAISRAWDLMIDNPEKHRDIRDKFSQELLNDNP